MVFIRSFNRDSGLSTGTTIEYQSVPEIRIHLIQEATLKPIALEAHRSGAGQSVTSMVLDQPIYHPYLCAQPSGHRYARNGTDIHGIERGTVHCSQLLASRLDPRYSYRTFTAEDT